jgi:pyruvate ferredoxin oxidoreductase alpha subunit
MKKTVECSVAIAETVVNCDPDVVACYPITPSTHIAEKLAEHWADGELKEYVATEGEQSALSVLIGAAATGARTFTTTSSQGLLYMSEVLFNASGMRLPIVMFIGNRAIGAPLNIWCDHQDSISFRDSGWIQIYVHSSQEAVDSVIQAYKIAEKTMIPVMVCGDGFFLTHTVETVEIPEKDIIKKYLPPLKMPIRLDPKEPKSLGVYAIPEHYQSFREDLTTDIENSVSEILKVDAEWKDLTGRSYGLFEEYHVYDAEHVIIAMGAQASNGKEAVNKLRANGEKVGILILRLFRPFPYEALAEVLAGKHVLVLDRSISPGAHPPLYSEVTNALFGKVGSIHSAIGGLGGRDLNVDVFVELFKQLKSGKVSKWI